MARTATSARLDRSVWRNPRSCRPLLPVTVILVLLALAGIANSQRPKPTEYEVKAAYLYNFGRFVRWPAPSPASDSFLICVMGQDPFNSLLDATVKGESIDGKPLLVKRILTIADAAKCRVVFISGSEQKRVDAILSELSKSPVLTVSDIPDFAQHGGDIGFILQGEKVRFEVNLSATEKAGLTLSSDLLKVAVSVKRANPPGD